MLKAKSAENVDAPDSARSTLRDWDFSRCCCADCQNAETSPATVFQPRKIFAELAQCKLFASRVFHVEQWATRTRMRIVSSLDQAAAPKHE